VAVDRAGNVFVADYGDARPVLLNNAANRIRRIAPDTGMITTVADGVFTSGGQVSMALDNAGNLIVADAQSAQIRKVDVKTGVVTTIAGTWPGFFGDGGPATEARFDHPWGVAVDTAGNILIADYGNNRIRKIDAASKKVTTVAGNGSADFSGDEGPAIASGLPLPNGVATDAAGNLYIADWANNDVNRVRKVEAETGIIRTVVGTGHCSPVGDGGPATSAGLCAPFGIATDSSGNVYIADGTAGRIRMLAVSTGIITTLAGNEGSPGAGGFSGDGGPAGSAKLNLPSSVAVDEAGNVFIADTGNNRVRKIDAGSGIITTIAGNGSPSSSGDREPPTRTDAPPRVPHTPVPPR
jgi:hypothetical protein